MVYPRHDEGGYHDHPDQKRDPLRSVLHLHLGDGPRRLDLLFRLAGETEIPPTQVVPTHVNRNPGLFDEALRWAAAGGTIDVTTGPEPEPGSPEVSVERAIALYLERRTLQSLLRRQIVGAADAARLFSANSASFYKLPAKGSIRPGKDADLAVFDNSWELTDVFSLGRRAMIDGRVTARGTFSPVRADG